jgi:Lhr-like helicase
MLENDPWKYDREYMEAKAKLHEQYGENIEHQNYKSNPLSILVFYILGITIIPLEIFLV